MLSLKAVLLQPWLREGSVKAALQGAYGELDSFVQQAARTTAADAGAVAQRGAAALARARGPVGRARDLLSTALAVTSRCERLRHDLKTQLDAFAVPADVVFALRSRFEDGWLPDYESFRRMLFEGARELLAGKESSQRAQIAGKNLERCAAAGVALLEEARLAWRDLRHVDRRLAERFPALLDYARAVEKAARAALQAGREVPGVDAAAIDALAAASRGASDAREALATEWRQLRPAVLAAKPEAAARVKALRDRLDAAWSGLMGRALPLGRALGLPAPVDPR